MIKAPRLDLSTYPDSPYAAELQRASPHMRFAPTLEALYLRCRLLDSRTLIRVASILTILLSALRTAEQAYEGLGGDVLVLHFSFVVTASLILAGIAWSPQFERLYPGWAQIIIPVRNAIIAAQVAHAVAHGQPEMLIVLPITFIGPFFFLGLPLRASLVCCAATAAAYVIFASMYGVSAQVALRTDVLLLGGIIACVIAVWNLEKTSRLSFLEGGFIAELAQRDPLTGTKNRRVFDEHLEKVWTQAVDRGRGLALLLIDIDHFKAYNDHYGHQAGDQALRRVAQTLQKFVGRPLDILTRYGGEEFAIILYDVDGMQARPVAERARQAIAEMGIEHRASRTASRVTISIGVAAIQPTSDRTPRGALQLADQALYQAKVQGRNRVELMDQEQHQMLVTGVFAIKR